MGFCRTFGEPVKPIIALAEDFVSFITDIFFISFYVRYLLPVVCVRTCGRAGVRACGRAGVRACGRAGGNV